MCCIGTTARFRQAERHERLAGDHFGRPSQGDFGPGMIHDDLSDQRVQQLDVGNIEVGIGDFLDDQPGRDPIDSKPAIGLRQVARNEPQRRHFLDEAAVDNTGFRALLEVRRDLLAREPARGILYCLLFVGNSEFHRTLASLLIKPSHHLRFPTHNRATKDDW